MYGDIQPLVTLKRGVYVWGYSAPCYTYEGCMYGAIQPLVTLKRGVCMELFNLLLHLRGVHVCGYSTPCYT